MTPSSLVPLAGSHREPLPDAVPAGPVDPQEQIDLTVVTRRAASLPRDADGAPVRLSRTELRSRYGSDPADHELVASVLTSHEPAIQVTSGDPESRTAHRQPGPPERWLRPSAPSSAWWPAPARTELGHPPLPQRQPADPGGAGRRHRRGARSRHPAAGQPAFPAREAAKPPGVLHPAAGRRRLPIPGRHRRHRPDGRRSSSLAAASPPPTWTATSAAWASRSRRSRRSAWTAPATSRTRTPNGADGEVLLDIEVVGSVAPGAAQLVYFAPNTDQGFVDAVTNAVHAEPTPAAVSISWGGPESSWTAPVDDRAGRGHRRRCGARRDGHRGGRRQRQRRRGQRRPAARGLPGVQPARAGLRRHQPAGRSRRPARSPRKPSGTTAARAAPPAAASVRRSRLPTWQATAGVPASPAGKPGRGVPDVAGNADPATGYQVLIDGQQTVIGGTSAVAPLWAALIARLAQSLGKTARADAAGPLRRRRAGRPGSRPA